MSASKQIHCALLCAASLFAMERAHAQTAAETQPRLQLPGIVVTAPQEPVRRRAARPRSTRAQVDAPARAAANRSNRGAAQPSATPVAVPPTPIAASPAPGLAQPLAASLVQPETLANEIPATSDTARLLRSTPGVTLYEAGGLSALPVLRGLADDRIRILLGGADITAACANHMNPALSYIDPANVGSVEVIAGVGPVSKGGDNIAGTIIVQPKAPVFARAAGGVVASGSASAFYRSVYRGLALAGSASIATDDFSVGYSGAWTRASNYWAGGAGDKVRSTEYRAENHAVTLGYRNAGQELTLRAAYQHIPRQGFVNQYMDMVNNESWSLDGTYKGAFDWGRAEASLYWRRVKHAMNFLADKLPGDMPMNTDGTDYGYKLKAEIPFSGAHLLRLGNEFHAQELSDSWPAVPGSMMMGPGTYWNINGGRRNRLGTFAEVESKWTPQWSTLLGARADVVWMNTGAVSAYSPLDVIGMGMMGMANPDAAAARLFNAQSHARTDVNLDLTALVRYEANAETALEAGYARKSRSPSLYERYAWGVGTMAAAMTGWFGDANGYIGNLNLKPEVAHTFSVTAAFHDGARKDWEVKITPYFSHIQGFIDVDYVRSFVNMGSVFNILRFANHDAQTYGVDASGRAKVYESEDIGRFSVAGVLGYVHGTRLDTGDHLYHMMPLNARLSLEHRLGGWSAAVETQLVAAKDAVQWVRREQTTPGYALFNVRAGYEFEHVRFDVGVENLFDKLYYPPLGGFDYADFNVTGRARPVPGPGRNVYAGMTVKF